MKEKTNERVIPVCPFGQEKLEAAKAAYLANPCWKDVYDKAPDGAKRRLEISFLFSANNESWGDRPDLFCKYREWREDMEAALTQEDLEYLVRVLEKPAAREHYLALLSDRKGERHCDIGLKLMSYDGFFGMLGKLGEFVSYDYDETTKRSILDDFLPVLENSGDPLETHVEDILATAKLKEARVYPKGEVMYVRVEVQFLTETAEWSRPYQMVAAWDGLLSLKGYAFPVGKGRRTELPEELEDPENEAQREKRRLLTAARIAR